MDDLTHMPGQTSIFDPKGGEQAKTEAIDRVEVNADEMWKAETFAAIAVLAGHNREMTTDDVWELLADWRPYLYFTTHEPRAMGAVMRKAEREGIITPTGNYVPSQRKECHRRPVRVWRSLRYVP